MHNIIQESRNGLLSPRITTTAGLLFAAFCSHSAMAAITVGQDGDPNCQFHDVGLAVAAAVQNPGPDVVQISTGTYTGVTNVAVTGSDELIIEGGFAYCSAGASTGVSLLDGQDSTVPGSIITHFGTGKLQLLHLTLTNGDSSGAGGGIDSQDSGELVLEDVRLLSNHALNGGGLFLASGLETQKVVRLRGVTIDSNIADGSGGGLYAAHANIFIEGDRPSYFIGNQAHGEATDSGDGGGIFALNSNLDIRSASVTYPFIGYNVAARNGGGIYFGANGYGDGQHSLDMASYLADYPLRIEANGAERGGALYLSMKSAYSLDGHAWLTNTRIETNAAEYGAAIYLEARATTNAYVSSSVAMVRSYMGEPGSSSIPPCAADVTCNTITGNRAFQSHIVDANTIGSTAATQFAMIRGRISNNLVDNANGALIRGHNGTVIIATGVVADNVAYDLISVDSGDVRVIDSTIANNTLAASSMFDVLVMPSSLTIENSILHDAGTGNIDAFSVGSGIPVRVRNVGTSGVYVSGTNVQSMTEPFADLANGDYHLDITSSAVDRWAPDPGEIGPSIDFDGATRPYIFNSPATPYDFGAYEAGARLESIFRDGFDPVLPPT